MVTTTPDRFTVTGEYRRPYSEYPHVKLDLDILVGVLKDNLRPSFPQSSPEEIVKLIKKCWEFKSEERPTVAEVTESLEALQVHYKEVKEDWDGRVPKFKTDD